MSRISQRFPTLFAASALLVLGACDGAVDAGESATAVPAMPEPAREDTGTDTPADDAIPGHEGLGDDEPTAGEEDDGYAGTTDWSGGELSAEWQDRLLARELNYGAALRGASLRLRGELPTLVEIRMLAEAEEPAVVYETLVASFIEDPRFFAQINAFYRDTFKMGGSAPRFAAQLAAEGRSMRELFTATTGTCPTLVEGVPTPGECDNGVPVHAGVLTHPGVMRQFDSNLGFRRVRWVQETFACSAFPAEHGDPVDVGGAGPYTAPWPFESIAGAETGGRIDFRDTESVICANCHATMNHLAPLFGRFDADGQQTADFAVTLPSDGAPTAVLSDWLPEGETTAWRLGKPAADLPALGAILADDPEVRRCSVARAWNWAFGKGDLILSRSVVPEEVIAPHIDEYVSSGERMDALLLSLFTSEDFVRF